jgi:hypothetical protein
MELNATAKNVVNCIRVKDDGNGIHSNLRKSILTSFG